MYNAVKQMDRKDSHLSLCLQGGVEYSTQNANGFGLLRFDHLALPEINKSEVDLTTTIFGKKLLAPFFIGAMTGGTDRAGLINRRLAQAAETTRIGFALGSQRKMIEDPSVASTYAVRESAPHIPLLIGNLGAVQLNCGVTSRQIQNLIKITSCDAFNFHLNPLQEAIQPEGNTDFSGLIEKLREIIPQMGIPVLLKEVGSGFSLSMTSKIKDLPIAGIETAGLGGTSWSKIESLRTESPIQKSIGELFARWGIPTAESVRVCRIAFPHLIIIASGGIRNGIEAAKALALGADAVGIALPLLKAAEKSVENAVELIQQLKEELRTVMFLTGSKNINELKQQKLTSTLDFTSLE